MIAFFYPIQGYNFKRTITFLNSFNNSLIILSTQRENSKSYHLRGKPPQTNRYDSSRESINSQECETKNIKSQNKKTPSQVKTKKKFSFKLLPMIQFL